MQILIKNGTIVTALDEYKADLLIENEKIVAIASDTLSISDIFHGVDL